MSKHDRRPHLPTPRAIAITNTNQIARDVEVSGRDLVTGDERTEWISCTPPAPMWWNNIRRAWFTGPTDAPVMCDPQPPPAITGIESPGVARSLNEAAAARGYGVPPSEVTRGGLIVPPAVKVLA